MKTVVTRGKRLEIPECVGELTPKQYEYYAFLALMLGSGAIDEKHFRVRWMSYLLGMGMADYTILKSCHIAEIKGQESAIDGFFKGGRLDFSATANLLPKYRGYKGPGDWLEGVAFGEFVECLTLMEAAASGGEGEADEACRLIARKLYHIPDADKVPDMLAFHAPTLLSSVWKALQSAPVEINGRKIDFRIIFRGSGVVKPDDNTGWTGIIFEVAQAGLFGNVAQVEQTDMWAVLMYLYKCKFEYLNEVRNNKK
ncbi:MAG: hypothetical protein NC102_00205 [Clostridium sp.]|nr:hypothetical protein [Clostridium sp.]